MTAKYKCPTCGELFLEDELEWTDVGGSEDYMGTRIHVACWVSKTPCHGAEPEEVEVQDEV